MKRMVVLEDGRRFVSRDWEPPKMWAGVLADRQGAIVSFHRTKDLALRTISPVSARRGADASGAAPFGGDGSYATRLSTDDSLPRPASLRLSENTETGDRRTIVQGKIDDALADPRVEYDQGDWVCVPYDDLYDLRYPRGSVDG